MAESNISHATTSESRQYLIPKEILHVLITVGQHKANMPIWKTIVGAIYAGFAVTFGGLIGVTAAGGLNATFNTNYPAIPNILFGLTVWIYLILIVTYGGELFTANLMYMFLARVYGKITTYDMWKNWIIVFIFNYIACGLGACVLGYLTEFYDGDPWNSWLIQYTENKIALEWGVMLVRGIGANWMLCCAVIFACASQDQLSRIVSCFIPLLIYGTCGFEQSVPNMFFVSLGQMYGANVKLGAFLWRNLLPVVIGEFIGGALFVGGGIVLLNLPEDHDAHTKAVSDSKYTTSADLVKKCFDYTSGAIKDSFHVLASFSKRYVRSDGGVIQLVASCVIELDENHKPYRILTRLIRHNVGNEDKLHVSAGVITLDWNGEKLVDDCMISSADLGACQLLGYSPDVLATKTVGQITYSDDSNLSTMVIRQALDKVASL